MKKTLCKILIWTLLCAQIPVSAFAAVDLELIKANMEKWYYTQFDQGTGTSTDPYIIDEAEDLEFMADTVFRSDCAYTGKYFRLDRDLYLNDITKPIREWKAFFPIGWDERAFEGHFDGGGHTIYGYKALVVDYNDCKGLFGRIKNGSIRNLTMSDSYFSSGISDGLHTAIFVNSISALGETVAVENCHSLNPRGNITRLITDAYATNGSTMTIKDCSCGDGAEAMIRTVTANNDAVITISGLVRNPKIVTDENGEEQRALSEAAIIDKLYTSAFSESEGTVIIENCINNCPVYSNPSIAGYSNVDREDYRPYAVGGILNASYKKSGKDIIRDCVNNGISYGIGGVGGIVGVFTNGSIENCINNGDIYGIEARVGGIVGQHTAGNITACVNRGDVHVVDTPILIGVMRFGGIAGVNNGVIESCINYGDLNGSPAGSGTMEFGGIAGRGSYIYNCANLGDLIGVVGASGGIAGTVALNVPEAVVDNCYNAGWVSASPYNSGSVIGVSQSPTLNCYYLAGTHQCGRYTDLAEEGFALPDYKALSLDEMKKKENFGGFDFVNIWMMSSELGYPVPRKAHYGDVAIPKETEIEINGKRIRLFGYNINGNNYYKIRDIAFLLDGTKSNFAVDWNEEARVIEINLKTPYTPIGNENKGSDTYERAVYLNPEKALLDGKTLELRAYKIDGSNYFTIREVADVVGFLVDWDEKAGRIIVKA